MCDCIERLEEQAHIKIETTQQMEYINSTWTSGARKPAMYMTRDGKKKKEVLVPHYCPFCGKPYTEEK
jgi:hypothetical protein